MAQNEAKLRDCSAGNLHTLGTKFKMLFYSTLNEFFCKNFFDAVLPTPNIQCWPKVTQNCLKYLK